MSQNKKKQGTGQGKTRNAKAEALSPERYESVSMCVLEKKKKKNFTESLTRNQQELERRCVHFFDRLSPLHHSLFAVNSHLESKGIEEERQAFRLISRINRLLLLT